MRESRFRASSAGCRIAVGTWSLAVALGASGVASAAPVVISVDCTGGDTIGAALVTARTTFEPVEIVVKGVCKERIVIDRDEVTLRGADATAGLDGGGLVGLEPLVTVDDAHRIVLDTLRLSPAGLTGLRLEAGAVVSAASLEIEGGGIGVALRAGTSLQLVSSSVFKSIESGIKSQGGHLDLRKCNVYDNGANGVGIASARLEMSSSKVVGNGTWGVSVIDNASATITSTTIANNAVGVFLRVGGHAGLGTGANISANRLEGIRVWDSATLILGAGAVVEGNGASGVWASGASVVVPQVTTIRNNAGDGIAAYDTSLVTSTAGLNPVITGNTGWGIRCEPAPGDARLAAPGFGPAIVFGNGAGQLSCPGFFIP